MSTLIAENANIKQSLKVPIYNNSTRPTTNLSVGDIIFNTSVNALQVYYNSTWNTLEFRNY